MINLSEFLLTSSEGLSILIIYFDSIKGDKKWSLGQRIKRPNLIFQTKTERKFLYQISRDGGSFSSFILRLELQGEPLRS
jgi:hypothetical protein